MFIIIIFCVLREFFFFFLCFTKKKTLNKTCFSFSFSEQKPDFKNCKEKSKPRGLEREWPQRSWWKMVIRWSNPSRVANIFKFITGQIFRNNNWEKKKERKKRGENQKNKIKQEDESADGSGESEVAGYDITVYIIGNPNDFFHHPPPFPHSILKKKKKKRRSDLNTEPMYLPCHRKFLWI